MEPQTKNCQNCKNDFIIESEDFSFYQKIKVPPPTFCVECRNIQRLATRNVKSLYRRPCDSCGQDVISRFSLNNPAKMFCHKCWWNDNWDPIEYGIDYDFSKTFFEQFYSLLISTPHASVLNQNMINSDYSNMESDDKNCYLTFGGHWNEDCAFSEYSINGKEVYDSYWSFYGEQCYDCINIEKCYQTMYSRECKNCVNTYFSSDCRGCTEIIGCVGLRNKSYCIFNQQYSKEEYYNKKKEINFGSSFVVKSMQKKAQEFWTTVPHLFITGNQIVNCTGNDIFNSKASKNVFSVDGVEDVKNLYIAAWSKDCQDESSTAGNELGYLNASGGGLYNCKAVLYSFGGDFKTRKHTFNSEYSYTILGSSDCFGCVGLRKKQYCILNKQYTKEEYFEMLEKIKNQMNDMPYQDKSGKIYKYGDFFPNEHPLFAYNETVANDFYPKNQKEAENECFIWREEQGLDYNFTDYEIEDDIENVKDDITQAVLKCKQSGKAYKITSNELSFYKKMHIPIPHIAPLERIKGRVHQLLPFKLWHRKCMKEGCTNEFETSYAPDRPEIIYCEKCYQQEVL